MEKLTLKELAPYLYYGLKILYWNGNAKEYVDTLQVLNYGTKYVLGSDKHKPILRPLSDLTKEIEHNGEKLIPEYLFTETFGSNDDTLIENMNDEKSELHFNVCKDLPYYVIEWLLSMHFDIFGLLDKNLAVRVTEDFNPYK